MKNDRFQKPWIVLSLAFICCLLWGSAIPMIKTGYGLMEVPSGDWASQILYAGIRFTLAGILAVVLGSCISRKPLLPSRNIWKLAFPLCMAQTVGQYVFFYIGVAYTSGVKGSILNATSTFFAILMACLLFRQEKLTLRKILGCLLGFAGVVIINVSGNDLGGGFSPSGEGCMLISSMVYGLSSVLIRSFSQKENPVALSGYQFFLGGLIMCGLGFGTGGRLHTFSLPAAAVLLYLAMVSAVAYSLWSILLKYNPVSRVTVYGFMNPLCGVVLSSLILGEAQQAFTVSGLLALVLVCGGIYVVNRP